ncbi:MAG: PIN domain-containing protein [Chloroflexi bacterium]|nr:PIN domain-containing protein [Chloroflexota bacterium]
MPETPKLIYWDSNAFLSYMNELPDRMPVLDVLLEASAQVGGAVKIHTSTLAQVEVAFAASEQAQEVLDPRVEQSLNELWADAETVISVEYHVGIGQIARNLIRNAVSRGWSLKPLDAIHLSTAQWLSNSGLALEEFHTYDGRLLKYESLVGFSICEPYTEQPRMI